jgi:hypothetical protein
LVRAVSDELISVIKEHLKSGRWVMLDDQ